MDRHGTALTQQVRRIQFGGKVCRIQEWPAEDYSALMDFGDDGIVNLYPSLAWMIVRG